MDELSDATLLAGFGLGDSEIGVAFVRRFQARVFGVTLAVLGDRRLAEDAAQLTFERVWKHADGYDELRGSVATWVATIARNLAIDMARARRPTPVAPDDVLLRLLAGSNDTERRVIADLDAEDLRRAICRLPAEQARAVVLAGIMGRSASQIAQSEGIPLGTAKTRVRTGMQRLRSALSEEHAGHE